MLLEHIPTVLHFPRLVSDVWIESYLDDTFLTFHSSGSCLLCYTDELF